MALRPLGTDMTVTLRPGHEWAIAEPLWSAAWWRAGATVRRAVAIEAVFDVSGVPDSVRMGFKLFGLSDVTARTERMERYGCCDQLVTFGHEDSDRIVGSVGTHEGQRGVWLSAYAYRRGYGGISPSRGVTIPERWAGQLHQRLGFCADGEPCRLSVDRSGEVAVYQLMRADGAVSSVEIPLAYPPSLLQKLEWSHADAGPQQRTAPATLVIRWSLGED
ncbi:MAG: hypothetical protein AAGJ10_07190 [Bacteroidota bacterium]